MTNISAPRDNNRIPTLIGVSSADGKTPILPYVDPTTHRVLVDLPGGRNGDVVGPASAVDSNFAAFDTTTGKLIKDSGSKASDFATSAQGSKADTSVQSISVASSNGLAGTSSGGTTPTLTLSTSVSGVLKGNGTAISAATDGTDYLSSTTGLKLDQTTPQTIINGYPIVSTGVQYTATTTPTTPPINNLKEYSLVTQGHTRPVYQDDDGIEITIGRDSFIIAKNTTVSTITKGQAVHITGSTGNVPNIGLAQANSTTTLPTIGIAMADITANSFGYVMTIGIVSGVDTSAFTSGDQLWVSTTTAGGLQNTRPSGTSGAYVQRIGSVLVSGVGNGSIDVDIAPFIGNMETGTAAPTWTGNLVYGANLIEGYTSTPTAAGTTTLTVSSNEIQSFTGTTTQTVVLPDATTLTVGHSFRILNGSTGLVTVNKNGGSLLWTLAANSDIYIICTDISTAAGSWEVHYIASGIASGKKMSFANSLLFSGTDGSSVAFGTGGTVLYSGGALGTPSSGTLTSCTGLPISTGVSGLGTGVGTFLATPSSANLATAITDETGSGSLVFGTNPTLTKPTLNGTLPSITSDTDGATITFDLSASNIHNVTLGGNRTLALTNISVGQIFMIELVQDATGSRTVTWFTTIKWVGGTTPTLTTTANKKDTFGFRCTGSGTYDGYIVGQNI
jgi:hypothetical protein